MMNFLCYELLNAEIFIFIAAICLLGKLSFARFALAFRRRKYSDAG